MNRRQLLLGSSAALLAQALPLPAWARPPETTLPGSSRSQTLTFIKDPYGFFEELRQLHGPLYRTRLLGKDIAVIASAEGWSAFLEEANVQREGAVAPQMVEVFGGVNMGAMDGATHRPLKKILLEAFSMEALAAYTPQITGLVETSLARWAAAGEVRASEETRRLSIEAICLNILGISPGEDTDWLREQYDIVTAGTTALPITIPPSRLWRTSRATRRLLDFMERAVADHRARPGSDGLSRIMAAEVDGRKITDAELRMELQHVIIAGYIIFAVLSELLIQLAAQPDLLARVRQEIQEGRRELVYRLGLEAKRTAPVVPFVTGTAVRDFSLYGHTIPAGWGVWASVWATNHDPAVYPDPFRFDPDRYIRENWPPHPHAYVPQGSGPPELHRCPGVGYADLMAGLFIETLVRQYDWSLPEQDMRRQPGQAPPVPRDGLRIQLRKRSA